VFSQVARRRQTLEKLFLNVLYVTVYNRPLEDVQRMRELQIMQGQTDLSTDPSVGRLADPSANYNSPTFVHEALTSLASVLRRYLAVELSRSPTLGLVTDETSGLDGNAHFNVCVQYITKSGGPTIKFAGCVRMRKDVRKVRKFLRSITPRGTSVPNFEIKLKGGANMITLIDEFFVSKFDQTLTWEKLKATCEDGAGCVTDDIL
jgi:hypothetical protein